jgi:hypothetical protein
VSAVARTALVLLLASSVAVPLAVARATTDQRLVVTARTTT